MFRVLSGMTADHDWGFVALAVDLCFLSSLIAVDLLHRARPGEASRLSVLWIIAAGVSVSCGVWATNFTAILAGVLHVTFAARDPVMAFALAIAPVASCLGFGIATYRGSISSAAVSGAVIGTGMGAMHYLGVWAQDAPVRWSIDLVALSIALGSGFVFLALVVWQRHDGLKSRLAAAALFSAAILSHEFTAIAAVEIVRDPTRTIDSSLTSTTLSLAIAVATIFIFAIGAVSGANQRLRERTRQLETAINNMHQALLMFDSNGRLVLWNARYVEYFGLRAADIKPGMLIRDLLKLRIANGTFRDDPDEYVRAVTPRGKMVSTSMDLPDGRTVLITYKPMPGGGWVSTHEDMTERRKAENALKEARTQAEIAEREARAVHERLRVAFDVVPEGLVLFDADDRLVLWNRHYAGVYAELQDELTSGARFEDLVRRGVSYGLVPDAHGREAEWLEDRLARHRAPHNVQEQRLPGDRWIRIEERRTPDGGSIGVRADITDLKRREASFRILFESNPLPMWVFDIQTFRFLAVNDAAIARYGYSREQFMTMTVDQLRIPEDRQQLRDMIAAGGGTHNSRGTRRHLTADGTEIFVAVEARALVYEGHDASVAVAFDLTERKRAEDRVVHLARHDVLTDLPNRAAFTDHLANTLEQAAQCQERFALLCLDLDRFREVNDVFGHPTGDALLREVARRLQAAAADAFLARIGGDEFTLIVSKGPQPSSAEQLVKRLQDSVAEDIQIGDHQIRTGLSIGVAIFPEDGRDATTLIGNADAALYRAKAEGRGGLRFFTAEMDAMLRERRALLHDLRSAISSNELLVHYQPQAKIEGEVVGFEALVRWRHPTRGMVSPGIFIPPAEESGLINPVGEWVLREACREAASWPRPLQVAVNLSPVQFRHGDLAGLVHSILLETGLKPQRLELEITESALIGDFSRAIAILRRLKAIGVKIAMDDFGTGYSSLSYLQSFPFDKIKIDQTFISNLHRNPQSAAIVRAVIGLGRGLYLPVVAEGVETEEQRAFLARENCQEIQGYLIGRPSLMDDYAALVGRQPKRTQYAAQR
jgi:diguanylate cyclase (GGDEF)-like protein/PAS domain S-box-containing protein